MIFNYTFISKTKKLSLFFQFLFFLLALLILFFSIINFDFLDKNSNDAKIIEQFCKNLNVLLKWYHYDLYDIYTPKSSTNTYENDRYEDEFLLNQMATEEWFPQGLKGDNITGYNITIVPNIVHYVLMKMNQISFVHYISIKSVLLNQKPDLIMFHCDCEELNGSYWERLNKEHKFNFKIRKINIREYVFGQKLNSKWQVWHLSDIIRTMVLIEFGGIYLDTDMYVVKSLDYFRKFEMTAGMDRIGNYIYFGNQIQIAHKRARFLKLYLNLYRNYDKKKWYWNAGFYPTFKIIEKYPHLIHKVADMFGGNTLEVCQLLYKEFNPFWQEKYYAIHLLMRNNSIENLNGCFPHSFPEKTIYCEDLHTINNTFTHLAKMVVFKKEIQG